jgi:hypothetical protein
MARIASDALIERLADWGRPHRATIATTLFRDKIEQLRS